MSFAKFAAEIWRDFVTAGVPASGVNSPNKADVLAWGTEVESRLPSITPVPNTVLTDVYFKTGSPWADVRAYGATGDGVTNDTTACQAAITAVEALLPSVTGGGGIVFFPPGNYSVIGGLTVSKAVRLVGAGPNATIVQSWHTDVTVIHLASTAQYSTIENMTIYGKGLNNDTGAFGSSTNAVVMSCTSGILRDLVIWGGSAALFIDGNDGYIENVYPSSSYGSANVNTTGSNWYIRCKIDHAATGIAETTAQPYPARANTTAYTVGQVRLSGGYAIQCSVAGTSGGSSPTLKNYGINITDGTVTWLLLAKSDYTGLLTAGAAGENHFFQCDFTGKGYLRAISLTNSLSGANGPAVCVFSDCVFANPIDIQAGVWTAIRGCEIGSSVAINTSYTGKFTFTDNYGVSAAVAIGIGVGVSNFVIANNILPTGAITVAVGGSDHFTIVNNVGASVTNGGTGGNKTVSGNVA